MAGEFVDGLVQFQLGQLGSSVQMEETSNVEGFLKGLLTVMVSRAENEVDAVMPGYTHLQAGRDSSRLAVSAYCELALRCHPLTPFPPPRSPSGPHPTFSLILRYRFIALCRTHALATFPTSDADRLPLFPLAFTIRRISELNQSAGHTSSSPTFSLFFPT